MTHEQFVQLVQRVERFGARHPASYRRRLWLLALLGYAYPLFLLVLLLGLLGLFAYYSLTTGHLSLGGLKLVLGVALLAWVILRALWVRLDEPEGIPVSREDAPPLFEVIDGVCAAVRAPRPSRVLIIPDYNAFAAQLPRFGLLGGEVTYLALGLPYLQASSLEQFRSVLAHEIGHLSENHGRFGVRIWRLHATWERLMEQLRARRHFGDFLLTWFAAWYGPYLTAYSFVARRAHEAEADRYAAKAAGPKAAAEALAASGVYDGFLGEEFWPGIYKQATVLPAPPEDAYEQLMRALREPLPEDKAEKWLLAALGPTTSFDDTHPALRDRLAVLGYARAHEEETVRRQLLPSPPPVTAAQELLGPLAHRYTGVMSRLWSSEVAPHWAQHREEAAAAEQRLAALAAKAASAPLSGDESWEQARLTVELRGLAGAEALFQEMHAARPDDARVNFVLGQCLLERDDESGVALMERAMAVDTLLVRPGCEHLYSYLRRRGRNEEAESYRRRAMTRYDQEAAALAEAVRFTKRDVFLPHDLAREVVDDLRQRLARIERAKEGYLVRRQLRADLGRPCYLLGIVPDFRGHFVDQDKVAREVLEQLHASGDPPVELFPVCLYANTEFVVKRLKKVEAALIHRRGGK